MKTCKVCAMEKPETAFRMQEGYFMRACTECLNARRRGLFAANPALREKKRVADKQGWEKHKSRRADANRLWRANNPERMSAYVRAYKARNAALIAERNRQYVANNPETRKASMKAYRATHKAEGAEAVRRRQARLLQRTPAWLTPDDIWMLKEAYRLAAVRSKLFGFPWHVDHVIPLQGKLVSGLHTPYNLRVIPGAENVRKSNKFQVS